jgi:hypothetical protein
MFDWLSDSKRPKAVKISSYLNPEAEEYPFRMSEIIRVEGVTGKSSGISKSVSDVASMISTAMSLGKASVENEVLPAKRSDSVTPNKQMVDVRMEGGEAVVVRRIVAGMSMTLLNLRDAKPESPLHTLADYLVRLENLSHILVWSSSPPSVQSTVDLIEFPRLSLTFRRETESGNYKCDELGGLRLSNVRNENILRFVEGLRTAVILQGMR